MATRKEKYYGTTIGIFKPETKSWFIAFKGMLQKESGVSQTDETAMIELLKKSGCPKPIKKMWENEK